MTAMQLQIHPMNSSNPMIKTRAVPKPHLMPAASNFYTEVNCNIKLKKSKQPHPFVNPVLPFC
jgi:hypothetical protein